MSFNVVGVSAYYHDSACAVLRDGHLIAAASEERFTRKKYDRALPQQAFRYCLREAGLTLADIDAIGYYEDPFEKLERQIAMVLPGLPADWRALGRLDPKRPERQIRDVLGCDCPLYVVKHHESHAASAFYFSGFTESALLTADGVGEWATSTSGRASRQHGIELLDRIEFPHSLGLFYSTLTSYLGFGVNDGEYKVMGLAPYGEPRFVDRLERLIELDAGGRYRLNGRYFDFRSSERMYSEELPALLGQPPRTRDAEIQPFHQNVARSAQVLLERVLLAQVRALHDRVPLDALCMAGGVALNCVANAAIRREGPFKQLFVQPAAGDAGGALGAAALAHVALTGEKSVGCRLEHAYYGPGYTAADIARLLDATKTPAADYQGDEQGLLADTADRLACGQVVGWFQGRMEFGPRALGARTILADPRDAGMRDRINGLVKKREAFRPFAPAVSWAHAREHFALDHPSPFMLETCQVISPLSLPAITHVDGSARVQTVDGDTNPRFAALLEAFGARTGCPILLNTSFNMKDEPIVCTPVDALVCFARAHIDALVLGDFVVDRNCLGPARQALIDAEVPLNASMLNNKIYTLI
jgi:carbamoyltransferase